MTRVLQTQSFSCSQVSLRKDCMPLILCYRDSSLSRITSSNFKIFETILILLVGHILRLFFFFFLRFRGNKGVILNCYFKGVIRGITLGYNSSSRQLLEHVI